MKIVYSVVAVLLSCANLVWAADTCDASASEPSIATYTVAQSTSQPAIAPPSCVCACGGRSWGPGMTACMGGFKAVCVDRGGQGRNCGWDPVKKGADQIRCDGGEHCK
jgi:hypothetical protein